MSDPLSNMGCGSRSIESICGLWRICSSSPSPPTYVGKSEFYVQTLDVVQTLE